MKKAGLLGGKKTKNIFITWFFNNTALNVFDDMCAKYAAEKIKEIVLASAMQKIHWHVRQGHRVVVVSASPEDYLQKWCDSLHIECIATKLQKLDGRLTGKIEGKNCRGPEKVNRIKAAINLTDYNEIYGYGNSSGDREMLALCTKPFYKIFH